MTEEPLFFEFDKDNNAFLPASKLTSSVAGRMGKLRLGWDKIKELQKQGYRTLHRNGQPIITETTA